MKTPQAFKDAHITVLEMLNVYIAVKVFCQHYCSKIINIFCDNSAVVTVLQTGKTKDPILAKIARNIFMQAASLDIFLKFSHVPGVDNQVADLLFRWDNSEKNIKTLHNLVPHARWINLPDNIHILNENI